MAVAKQSYFSFIKILQGGGIKIKLICGEKKKKGRKNMEKEEKRGERRKRRKREKKRGKERKKEKKGEKGLAQEYTSYFLRHTFKLVSFCKNSWISVLKKAMTKELFSKKIRNI